MKKISYLAFALLGLVGCGSNEPTVDTVPLLETVDEAEITFDQANGEQSTQRNFYFIVDGSGSMQEECAGEIKLNGAKRAITQFLQKVPEDVNLGLLVFGAYEENNGIKEVVALNSDNRGEFQTAINAIVSDGGTPLSNATDFAMERLVEQYKKQLGYGEYRLIIVTDGEANEPALFHNSLIQTQQYPFVAIYGIGLCVEADNTLKSVAYSYTDAGNYEELGKALEQAIAELPSFDPGEFEVTDTVGIE